MKLRNIIRYILAIVFLLLSILKLADYKTTAELFTSILGLEIALVKIFLGVLTLLELIIAYLFVSDYIKRNLILLSITGIIITFLIVNLFFLVKGYRNCGCFGNTVSSSPLLSIIKNAILLIGLYYLWNNKLLIREK